MLTIKFLRSAVLNTKICEAENKIPDVSGLATTPVLNTTIGEIQNKISNIDGLVKKLDYETKIKYIKGKYFTTSDYNKFTSNILDAEIKQK